MTEAEKTLNLGRGGDRSAAARTNGKRVGPSVRVPASGDGREGTTITFRCTREFKSARTAEAQKRGLSLGDHLRERLTPTPAYDPEDLIA